VTPACLLTHQRNAMPGNDKCKCHLMPNDFPQQHQYTNGCWVSPSKGSVLGFDGMETTSGGDIPSLFSASMIADLEADDEDTPQKEKPIPGALKRAANVEEIAEVASFLASPRASYVTGALIAIDGGRTAI
jgi:hypothetical protein